MAGESQQTPGAEPDPSVLTTEQLLRETESIKDWAKELVAGVEAVTTEKFNSVEKQIVTSERQRVEQKQDAKESLAAALAAAKEAVQEQTKASGEAINKSESQSTAAQQQLATQFQEGIKGVGEILGDIKDRVVRLETTKLTETTVQDRQQVNYGLVIGVVGGLVGILGLIASVLIAFFAK